MTTLFPDVTIEFSPTTDPLDPPAWEDISAHLRSFSISRGRSRDLDRAEAGTATIELDNSLGYFDPTKTDGPYYPGIRPMRRVRVRSFTTATWDPFTMGSSFVGGSDVLGGSSVGIDLFSGFVESWSQHWTPEPFPKPDASATIRAVDAFKILAMTQGVNPTGSNSSGGAVAMILNDIGITDWSVEAGSYLVELPGGTDTVVLAALQEIDASEGGLFFAARDGTLTFYGAGHVLMNPPALDQVWGDATAERQYQSITIDTDESIIWNEIEVTSPNAATVTVSDDASMAHYRPRPVTLSTVLSDTTQMQTRAYDVLSRFSAPRQRITSLEVGVRDDAIWDDILSKDLLERIVVRRRPYWGLSGLIEQDSVIQGITIKSESRFRWSVVWTLSATPSANLLTPNQASPETNTTGWVDVSNCTIALANNGVIGIHCLRMTATADGDMSASTTPNTQLAVVPGRVYSAMAGFSDYPGGDAGTSDGIPRDCHVEITWRNSGGTILSSTLGTTAREGGPSGFVSSAATGVAPASAAFATVLVVVASATSGTSHYVDTIGFAHGEQTGWSPGMGV